MGMVQYYHVVLLDHFSDGWTHIYHIYSLMASRDKKQHFILGQSLCPTAPLVCIAKSSQSSHLSGRGRDEIVAHVYVIQGPTVFCIYHLRQ